MRLEVQAPRWLGLPWTRGEIRFTLSQSANHMARISSLMSWMVQVQTNFTDRTSSSCRCSMTWNGQRKMSGEIAWCGAGARVQIANQSPLEHWCFCGPIEERIWCTLDCESNWMWDEVAGRMADIFALQTPRLVLACNVPRSNGELLTKGSRTYSCWNGQFRRPIRHVCTTWSANGTARIDPLTDMRDERSNDLPLDPPSDKLAEVMLKRKPFRHEEGEPLRIKLKTKDRRSTRLTSSGSKQITRTPLRQDSISSPNPQWWCKKEKPARAEKTLCPDFMLMPQRLVFGPMVCRSDRSSTLWYWKPHNCLWSKFGYHQDHLSTGHRASEFVKIRNTMRIEKLLTMLQEQTFSHYGSLPHFGSLLHRWQSSSLWNRSCWWWNAASETQRLSTTEAPKSSVNSTKVTWTPREAFSQRSIDVRQWTPIFDHARNKAECHNVWLSKQMTKLHCRREDVHEVDGAVPWNKLGTAVQEENLVGSWILKNENTFSLTPRTMRVLGVCWHEIGEFINITILQGHPANPKVDPSFSHMPDTPDEWKTHILHTGTSQTASMTTCQPICWNQLFLTTAKCYSKEVVLHSQYGRRHSARRLIIDFKMSRNHKWRSLQKKHGVVTEDDMKENIANSFLSFSLGWSISVFPPDLTLFAGRSHYQLPWPCQGGSTGQRQGRGFRPWSLRLVETWAHGTVRTYFPWGWQVKSSQNAQVMLEAPLESAMSCKSHNGTRHSETRSSNKRKTRHACIVEAHEPTRKRAWETQQKDSADHIADKRCTSLSHYDLVQKPIPILRSHGNPLLRKPQFTKNGTSSRSCQQGKWPMSRARKRLLKKPQKRGEDSSLYFAEGEDLQTQLWSGTTWRSCSSSQLLPHMAKRSKVSARCSRPLVCSSRIPASTRWERRHENCCAACWQLCVEKFCHSSLFSELRQRRWCGQFSSLVFVKMGRGASGIGASLPFTRWLYRMW